MADKETNHIKLLVDNTKNPDNPVLSMRANNSNPEIIMEVSFNLISLFADDQVRFKDRMTKLHNSVKKELGFKPPAITIRDNSSLEKNHYSILSNGYLLESGVISPNKYLAFHENEDVSAFNGEVVIDPVFKMEAIWIEEDQVEAAMSKGFEVLDSPTVMITHIKEMIFRYGHEYVSRQDVNDFLKSIEESHPVLINELKQTGITLSTIQLVLKNLLFDHISINQAPTILEALIDASKVHRNADDLTGHVRERISREILSRYQDFNDNEIRLIEVTPKYTEKFKITHTLYGYQLDEHSAEFQKFLAKVQSKVDKEQDKGHFPVIVVKSSPLRFALSRALDRYSIDTFVITYSEIKNYDDVTTIDTIK